MGFTLKQMEEFHTFVEKAEKPMILFDDDCDGTASYLMLMHVIGAGRGLPVKKTPVPADPFVRKIKEYAPDVVFILDKADVEPELLEQVTVPIVWLDHHSVQENLPEHVHYFNPKIADGESSPTAHCMYQLVGKPSDLWIAAWGTVGDWYVADFLEEAKEMYPDLLPATWERIEDLYVDTPIGEMVKVVMFNLKGTLGEMLESIKVLLKIEHPDEILKQTTSRGKYIWRKYRARARPFDLMVETVRKVAESQSSSPFLIYEYENDEQSFTAEISNEMIIRYPGKVIVVARRHNGEVKTSLRSFDGGPAIDKAVAQALEGIDGTGGGHPYACGACIKRDDWPKFLEAFKQHVETR